MSSLLSLSRSVSFFGRTLAEYSQFFSLDLPALRGRTVLDVAAGPASFTAEAAGRGLEAVAVDPLYGCNVDALATHVQLDYSHMFAQVRAKPHLVRIHASNTEAPPYFPSIDAAEQDRRTAARRFLADYESGFLHGRYVGGALPSLPFLDRSFDLVLCAHLLFLYSDRFDYAWHLAACRELLRVSAGEVRIHPVCGLDGKPYRELPRLHHDLAAEGVATNLVPVDYEFFIGANSMLVLRPNC